MEERTANRWARRVGAAVLVLGLVVVAWPGLRYFDWSSPYHAQANSTALVQILGAGGLLVGRLVVVVMVAFVAAGLTQRFLMGQFQFRAGGWGLDALKDSDAALEALRTKETQLEVRVDSIDSLLRLLDPDEGEA